VLEWPVGDTLADLLSEGLIEPLAAARIVAEAAAALSGAHAAGLAHLCLRPDAIRWTAGGGVKVTGLGIDAALSDVTADDPELADTYGLGQLLYAALTGLWPGPDSPELAPAPRPDGELARPASVRAGVPPSVDEIAWRALGLSGFDGQEAYQSPAEFAAALSAAIPPARLPTAPMQRERREAGRTRVDWPEAPGPDDYLYRQSARSLPLSVRRRPMRAAAVSALVVVAVAGASAAAVHLLHRSAGANSAGRSPAVNSSPVTKTTVIAPVSASGFDALNPNNDAGDENSNQAANVLDHNPAGWSTQQYYSSPFFGHLKAGTGLILNLGHRYRLTSVTVTFGTVPGADVEIKVGNSDTRSPANLAGMTTVSRATNVSGSHTFTARSRVTGRYLVIWFTKLPPMAGTPNQYMAQIFGVVVRGTA
jgi:hypothetical protein